MRRVSRVENADSNQIRPQEAGRLRRYNVAMGILHLIQGLAILVLSNGFSLPVTATFANSQPGGPVDPSRLSELFTIPLGPAVAAFLLISALAHLVVASPFGFPVYISELEHRRDRFRWVEYAFSASLMIVLIAMLAGISDIVALLALFAVNACMIMFGWLMETGSRPGPGADWTPFSMGCIAGIVPWASIAIYLIGAGSDVPGFVYVIFATLFVAFNSFALNQYLQYRRIGPWRDYLFGERVYIALSLTAKSLLAWQVFANTLV